jgi:hypothetical protein
MGSVFKGEHCQVEMAERAIRPGVLRRRGSFGAHSPEGSWLVEAMMTMVATCGPMAQQRDRCAGPVGAWSTSDRGPLARAAERAEPGLRHARLTGASPTDGSVTAVLIEPSGARPPRPALPGGVQCGTTPDLGMEAAEPG